MEGLGISLATRFGNAPRPFFVVGRDSALQESGRTERHDPDGPSLRRPLGVVGDAPRVVQKASSCIAQKERPWT